MACGALSPAHHPSRVGEEEEAAVGHNEKEKEADAKKKRRRLPRRLCARISSDCVCEADCSIDRAILFTHLQATELPVIDVVQVVW